VLVIATPCPLILAVPVAIVSGLSRAARHGVLIKGRKALEMIARIRTLVIDKTGTLTDGRARIVRIDAAPGQSPEEVLQAAASLDQASKHVIAQTIVFEAHDRRLRLAVPTNVIETAGEGIEGRVAEFASSPRSRSARKGDLSAGPRSQGPPSSLSRSTVKSL
jgi:P-type E1-E2 ATPase